MIDIYSEEAIEGEIKRIASRQFGIPLDAFCAESAFIEDLGADSLDAIEVVMAMEEVFLMMIPDDRAGEIVTVSDAARLVADLQVKMIPAMPAAADNIEREPLPH